MLLNEEHFIIDNNEDGFIKLNKWIEQHNLDKALLWLVFEYTGIYCANLCKYCTENKIAYTQVAALEIKKTMGITRGKNDKVDAQRIAEFACLKRHKLMLSTPVNNAIEDIKRHMTLREQLVKQRAGFMSTVKEYKHALSLKNVALEISIQQELIEVLTLKINAIEAHIKAILKQHLEIQKNYKLLISIKGVGFVVAIYTIIYTHNFTKFNNGRKFACFAGIAPFEHSSGKKIMKSRISHLANKKMKALLNQSAIIAIQHDTELRQYYQRRIEIGKNKMSTINVVRNKIVARIFAVIHKQKEYEIKIAA